VRSKILFAVSLALMSVLVASTTAGAVATSSASATAAQAPVNLGTAASFAILTQSGVTDVPHSTITGNVGTSPISGAAIGLKCKEVTGTIYSVDAAGPLPCRVTNASLLTTAVNDMETAYTDAAGRTLPNSVNLGAGEIGGLTLTPGLYKWTSNLSISKSVTLTGSAKAVWIFQIAGTLTQASATKVILKGGALATNVFWQSAGAVAIGTTAHFEGTILAQTNIAMNTGSSINGRLLAQTAVTLQKNTVTRPAK
jgi:Ice-binding-like